MIYNVAQWATSGAGRNLVSCNAKPQGNIYLTVMLRYHNRGEWKEVIKYYLLPIY